MSRLSILFCLLLIPTCVTAQEEALLHFEKSVRPLLVRRCVKCHGAKKQESGLRLDSRSGLLKGGEVLGPAIDWKRPASSVLLKVVKHEGDITMPPDSRLTSQEIRDLQRWIQMGAAWPRDQSVAGTPQEDVGKRWEAHFASRVILEPKLPVVMQWSRVYQPLDRFILKRLEDKGISPSPIADAATLIRRAHFVLTGLPPSYKEVERFRVDFAADPGNAMNRLVDRLLESPHYGERWGRHWLDVARYADTKGYVRLAEQPNYYYAYTYRDYVVAALNRDVPYNQFIVEQLAADQLVQSDDNRKLAALGFLTLGRRFTGNQHDVIDDRIDVVTRGLMGLTVACSRCHDHKFDPIPTSDYYALYGVFASSTEPSDLPMIGRERMRSVFAGDPAVYRKKRAELDRLIKQLVPKTFAMLRDETPRYLKAVLKGRKIFLVPLPAEKGELRQTFVERWVEYLEATKGKKQHALSIWHALHAIDSEMFATEADKLIRSQPGNSRLKEALLSSKPKSMTEAADVIGNELAQVHRIWMAESKQDPSLKQLEDPSMEELRQILYGADSPFAMSVREALDAYLLDANENQKLAQAYLSFDGWLIGTGKAAHRAHVLYDSKRVHEPHIFIRGNPERIGRRVSRSAPALLGHQLTKPFKKGSGRLELARAIVSPDNPLTARVIVNRVWKHHFGRGIVATTSNFGLRAESPTHPQLLDFLAARFISDGWSLKRLHRQIILSSTWQQQSYDRPAARQGDPENLLLWKANRRRVDFESLRDAMLSAARRLDSAIGGRPIGLLDPNNRRRSIYGLIDRSKLPTVLRLFDFPSPDAHNANRSKTTAPQQALFLMNSPFVMKQAEEIAKRAREAGPADTPRLIRRVYELAFARGPSKHELESATAFVSNGPGRADNLANLAQLLLISNEFLFVD